VFWRSARLHKTFDPIVQSCLLWCIGPNAKGLKRAIQTHSTAFEKRVMQSVVGGQGFQKIFKMIKKHAGFCFTKSCMRSSVFRPNRSQWVEIREKDQRDANGTFMSNRFQITILNFELVLSRDPTQN
jgi:hypothetical protein